MVSNITAGSRSQIDAVCASGIVPHLVWLIEHEEFDIRKEAAYALCNACIGSSRQTLNGLISSDVLSALCTFLDCSDVELLLNVCEALRVALAADQGKLHDGTNESAHLIEAAGGCDKLDALQMHQNQVLTGNLACFMTASSRTEPLMCSVVNSKVVPGYRL